MAITGEGRKLSDKIERYLNDVIRDFLVRGAVGAKSFNGTTFNTVAKNLTAVMPAGSKNVNHSRYFLLLSTMSLYLVHRYLCRRQRRAVDRHRELGYIDAYELWWAPK